MQERAADILLVMKKQLAEIVSRAKYELLVRPLRAVDYSDSTLTLSTSNEALRGWLLDKYGDVLSELANLASGENVKLVVQVAQAVPVGDGSPSSHDSSLTGDGESDGEVQSFDPLPVHQEEDLLSRSGGARPLLNPKYSFDSFVVGANNQFCYSACQQVAARPGRSYNPLFIYSSVGLGKTHLMHAVGQAIWDANPRANVIYVTSEKFTNDFIEHVRTGRMAQFHARYREADVLMIDDIQFLSGKQETQIEFFHTFMSLVEAGKQIVISSDRHPRTLKGIEDRLVSRFAMGLVCDISDPSLETRVAILQRKAEMERVDLPQGVCEFIAERVSSNVRELEGALIKLLAYCSFNRSAPSVELAARVLADMLDAGGMRPQLSMKQILSVVGEYFNVSEQLLLSPNRSKRVAQARMVVMYLAREYTNLTLSQIGEELGGRDHSTVSHGAAKIQLDLQQDHYLEQAIIQISRMLK
ncbi:chromosomal replication initiator protein DnaA [bacterium]|nr:chromosomal replication initiator protein DnaA [bacterium]